VPTYSSGTARVDVDGRFAASMLMTALEVGGRTPTGFVDLQWSDTSQDTLVVLGRLRPGRVHTEVGVLHVELSVNGSPGLTAHSEGGECAVRVNRADAHEVSGSLRCRHVGNRWANGEFVSFQGTFSAT
jgi:hypothetical protein